MIKYNLENKPIVYASKYISDKIFALQILTARILFVALVEGQ